MNRNKNYKIIGLILISLALTGCQKQASSITQTCFENNCLSVEIAQTSKEKTTGLMNHTKLQQDRAMLFVYDKPRQIGIWMKNMDFPIDILWLDENLDIVHFVKNAPPCQPDQQCQSYVNQIPAQYVLELSPGLIEQFSLELGQTAEFKY